jgi:3-oxoacyl-[acyl-carrier-protein] synthase III
MEKLDPNVAVPIAVGISAIATYEPPWVLGNDWFGGTLPRKFVEHSGIVSRHISLEDEVTMALRAVENLHEETRCDLSECAAVVFVASSLVPASVARKHLNREQVLCECTHAAAKQFIGRLGIPVVRVFGINWGCSGYSRAMAIVHRFILPSLTLRSEQFILLVTVNRTSKIVDFGCKQTAPVFGDMAQATLLAGVESERYPVHFALVYAAAENQPADGVFFDFHLRENVLAPTPDGGRCTTPERLVFSINMMGIAEAAPRAMADATAKALRTTGIPPEEVEFVIPHQAGVGIVRLAAMTLDRIGVRGEVINGVAREVGNVSSSSVPYALKQNWSRLKGTIVCPTAGVGRPGRAQVSQGCIVLKSRGAL